VPQHHAENGGALTRPVLERLFDEARQRHDQPALVPDADHHIGRGDLLHPAPFALDDQHIVDAYRLGQRDLHAGDQIGEDWARGEAEHEAGDAGGGEQAYTEGLHGGKHHEARADRQQAHGDHGHAPQNVDLGVHAPGGKIVLDVHAVAPLDTPRGGVDGDGGAPAEENYHADFEQPPYVLCELGVELDGGHHDDEREQDGGEPRRPGDALQDAAGHAFAVEDAPHRGERAGVQRDGREHAAHEHEHDRKLVAARHSVKLREPTDGEIVFHARRLRRSFCRTRDLGILGNNLTQGGWVPEPPRAISPRIKKLQKCGRSKRARPPRVLL
jgi:hypothetical protein